MVAMDLRSISEGVNTMVVDKQEVTSRAAVKWARRFFRWGKLAI